MHLMDIYLVDELYTTLETDAGREPFKLLHDHRSLVFLADLVRGRMCGNRCWFLWYFYCALLARVS